MRYEVVTLALSVAVLAADLQVGPLAQQPNPRQQPGAPITLYAPEQHDLYDGLFTISASRVYMVGTLQDAPGWDHMDNAAATVRPVQGTAEITVNQNYEMHFMVTQGIRDRKTLRVNYPMANRKSPAGEVNPATQQGRSAYADRPVSAG